MRLVLDSDVLEVTNRVESRIAKQSAVLNIVSLDAEMAEEIVDLSSRIVVLADFVVKLFAVRKATDACSVLDADTCNWVKRNERLRILAAMIVGTLHECALRISVANLQIGTYRRDKITQNLLARCVEFELICAHNQSRLYV